MIYLSMTGILSACVAHSTKPAVTTFSAAPRVVDVAAEDIIRIETPFAEPNVITTRDAEITIRQHVIYILTADLGEFPMFVTDANNEANAIALTLRPEPGGVKVIDVASFGAEAVAEEPLATSTAAVQQAQSQTALIGDGRGSGHPTCRLCRDKNREGDNYGGSKW